MPAPRSPEDTAWEDGTFKLSVEFTEEYPNKAPTVKFLTKMFHPNSMRRRPPPGSQRRPGSLTPALSPTRGASREPHGLRRAAPAVC